MKSEPRFKMDDEVILTSLECDHWPYNNDRLHIGVEAVIKVVHENMTYPGFTRHGSKNLGHFYQIELTSGADAGFYIAEESLDFRWQPATDEEIEATLTSIKQAITP